LLGGQPLIAHSIIVAQQATSLDRFIVSTEDQEIANIAITYGAEVPFLRPAELAQDESPDLPVFQHALSILSETEHYRPEILVHLRPTQPFRTPREIDEVVERLIATGADCVKSVLPVTEHPHKMYRLKGESLLPYLTSEFRMRVGPDYPRQQLEPLYISAGVVDAVRTEVVEAGSTEGRTIIPYLVDSERYVNLDTVRDFEIAEVVLKRLRSTEEHGL
jgi:CMP-N-acetylneuraminic acid synthetase